MAFYSAGVGGDRKRRERERGNGKGKGGRRRGFCA